MNKNLSFSTESLYYINLFQVKNFEKKNFKMKIKLSINLVNKTYIKKNLYNPIFLLYFLTRQKPKLLKAKNSNALLKIRKGGLIETFTIMSNFNQVFIWKYFFTNLRKELMFLILNMKKQSFSKSIKLNINFNHSHFWKLLFNLFFQFNFLFSFPYTCIKKQLFLSSLNI